MKRLLAVALLFGLLLPLTFSACDLGPECGPFDDYRRVTTDFTSGAFAFAFPRAPRPDSSTLSRLRLAPIGEDTLLYSDFAIRMLAETEALASSSERDVSFRFVSPAYACSPPLPRLEEVIEDIQIYSDEDFNDQYAAGDDLAPLFDVLVPAHFNDPTYWKLDLNTFLATGPRPTGEIVLRLKAPPQAVSSFQFTVQYTQESEGLHNYAFQTEPVALKPD